VARRTGILKEFLLFMRQHKAYWMAPLVLVILLLVVLVILGGTGAAPFIYTLF
jgi:hypothetical protein